TRRIAGRKKDKEHLSVALCTNANGNNTKAWMLVVLFQEWLQDYKLDELTLQHVDVHFLPKNTTSRLQPIDTGIIIAFKKAYRRFHLRWMLEQIEGWEEVLADTICNCWHHTQILPLSAGLSDNHYETNNSGLRDLINSLNMLCLPNAMEVDEFLNISGEDIIYEVPPEDQAIKELAYVFKNDESIEAMEEEDMEVIEDDSVELAIISASSALNSLENIRMFLL
ncbi:5462_t:CDS:2, partial [Dentiscutata erythropus]